MRTMRTRNKSLEPRLAMGSAAVQARGADRMVAEAHRATLCCFPMDSEARRADTATEWVVRSHRVLPRNMAIDSR